jgi:hypothetical protein
MTESPITESDKLRHDSPPKIAEEIIHVCFMLRIARRQLPAVPQFGEHSRSVVQYAPPSFTPQESKVRNIQTQRNVVSGPLVISGPLEPW